MDSQKQTMADFVLDYFVKFDEVTGKPYHLDSINMSGEYENISDMALAIAKNYLNYSNTCKIPRDEVKYSIQNLANEFRDKNGMLYYPLLRPEFKRLCQLVDEAIPKSRVILDGSNMFGKKN